MATHLDEELAQEMAAWERAGLRRLLGLSAEVDLGRDFTSNDTLSLAGHTAVIEAARAALAEFGAGGRAARLLGGGCPLDRQAEQLAAAWLSAEDALLFPSGYQANLGLVSALAGRGDLLCSDELNHASLIDAARLSRAEVAVFPHGDVAALETLLRRGAGARRRLVLVESVFSMDGDAAPLAALAEVCARHDAGLIVDEAHAVGLLGPGGAGLWAQLEAEGALSAAARSRLAARLVTGGKALGVAGGLVVGSRALREHLVNHARSFVFTSGVSPAVSGGLCAAIPLAAAADTARAEVRERAALLAATIGAPAPAAAIVAHVLGEESTALALEAALRQQGFVARAVRPPTVPAGTARLRLVCHAHNSEAEVTALAAAIVRHAPRTGRALSTTVAAASTPANPTNATVRPLVVVGTDTNVGKTVVSALLLRAAARRGRATYWKPVQTGLDSDTETVRGLVADLGPTATATVSAADSPACTPRLIPPLHSFPLPASPHEAAAAAGSHIDIAALEAAWITHTRETDPANAAAHTGTARAAVPPILLIELAGGLLVPYDARQTQADLLQRLRPQIVLVARSGLGTLNHTLLTVEALAARELVPAALFLVGPPHESNRTTLAARTGVPLIYELPPLTESADNDQPAPAVGTSVLTPAALDAWLARHDLSPLWGSLDAAAARTESTAPPQAPANRPSADAAAGQSLVARDAARLWHPYTQHAAGVEPAPLPVVAARDALLTLADGRQLIDAISSWWTSLHGHGRPELIEAMTRQARTLDHVLFAGATHEPAVALAEALLAVAPPGLARVFYSDDGSTAVEVALKMARQAHVQRGQPERDTFVALEGGYHGDTFGAMAVGDPEPFFRAFAPLLFAVRRAPVDGAAHAVGAALAELGPRAAGVIVEPLVQGAGGMRLHAPDFLRAVRAHCDRHGVPLIADEVMTGFGRTGTLFACEQAGVTPDLLCLAKGLTGGLLPLAATLATEPLFASFVASERGRAFFHGHSFTAHPIACAVALASLEICRRENTPARLDALGRKIELALRARLRTEGVESSALGLRRLGGIVALELPEPQHLASTAAQRAVNSGAKSNSLPAGYLAARAPRLREFAAERGVLLRPLGSTLYAMPPSCTSEAQAARIAAVMAEMVLAEALAAQA
ncbi:MAG: adenosylmethionine--8-amino-7-oxononanoate transaminase [Planctomycetota bacterium]